MRTPAKSKLPIAVEYLNTSDDFLIVLLSICRMFVAILLTKSHITIDDDHGAASIHTQADLKELAKSLGRPFSLPSNLQQNL